MPPSNSKPTFYTVFSNSPKAEEFLPNLSEEAGKIADHLNGLAFTDMIYYMKDELFSADRLIDNFMKYGEKFTIFYFSGHAKDGSLQLSDNFITSVDKMAALINNLRGLKLAFFNACETFDLARAIVRKRMKSKNPAKLEIIACGREVNTYAAEHFGHKFIIHAGREGTFFDAYQHARDLVVFTNDQVVFREFTTLEEMESSDGNFDFAYVDIDPAKQATAVAPPAAAAAGSADSPFVPSAAPSVAPPKSSSTAPSRASTPERSSPPSPVSGPSKSSSETSSQPSPEPAQADSLWERSKEASATPIAAGSPAPAPTLATAPAIPSPAPAGKADVKLAPSMLKIDKKTDDILAANYLRECIQMVTASGNLKPAEVTLLNDALDKAKLVADGAAISAKIKEVWEQAAKLLPGVNAENDFKALAKVSKVSYNSALDRFYGKTDNRPVVKNILASTEQAQAQAE
ncbi:MAG: hypothetical protein EOP49_28095, partial [Sphingobacteriales bacterium]